MSPKFSHSDPPCNAFLLIYRTPYLSPYLQFCQRLAPILTTRSVSWQRTPTYLFPYLQFCQSLAPILTTRSVSWQCTPTYQSPYLQLSKFSSNTNNTKRIMATVLNKSTKRRQSMYREAINNRSVLWMTPNADTPSNISLHTNIHTHALCEAPVLRFLFWQSRRHLKAPNSQLYSSLVRRSLR